MKVQVEDKLFIESDDTQFILKQYSGKFVTDEKGNEKETFKVLGYFTKLQQAIKKLVVMEVMKSDASTLKELLADVERIEKRIEELIGI